MVTTNYWPPRVSTADAEWIAANVVAVKMIFRPYERISILGLGFQGVLPKHQEHFARMLAGIIVRDFVTAGDLVNELAKPEAVDGLERAAKAMAHIPGGPPAT